MDNNHTYCQLQLANALWSQLKKTLYHICALVVIPEAGVHLPQKKVAGLLEHKLNF